MIVLSLLFAEALVCANLSEFFRNKYMATQLHPAKSKVYDQSFSDRRLLLFNCGENVSIMCFIHIANFAKRFMCGDFLILNNQQCRNIEYPMLRHC